MNAMTTTTTIQTRCRVRRQTVGRVVVCAVISRTQPTVVTRKQRGKLFRLES